MNLRLLAGEVDGRDIIDIGDIIEVTLGEGEKITGRLNEASKEEIKVGLVKINVEEVNKIEKLK